MFCQPRKPIVLCKIRFARLSPIWGNEDKAKPCWLENFSENFVQSHLSACWQLVDDRLCSNLTK